MQKSHEISLDLKPAIIPIYRYLPIGRLRYLFWNAERKTILEGKFIHNTLPDLLTKLDGSKTLEEIIKKLPDIPKEDILYAIEFLHDKEFLTYETTEVKMDFDKEELEFYKHWLHYLQHFNPDPQKYFKLLKNAQVGLIFNGPIGLAAGINLAAMGIGKIILPRNGTVKKDEVPLCPHIKTGHIGKSWSDVLNEIITSTNPYPEVIILNKKTGSTWLSILFDYSHFVILCDEDNRKVLQRQINSEAIQSGKPFLSATLDGFSGTIGPTVIPGQTACMECLHSRKSANSDHYDEEMALSKHRSGLAQEDFCFRPPAFFLSLVGEVTASEAARVISGFIEPLTLNKYLYINYKTLNMQSHPVLRIPRCKVCGRLNALPRFRLWGFE